MVYVILTGRLGNVLFQIATARSLSNDVTAIALHEWPRDVFNQYKDSFFKGIKLIDYIPDGIPVYEEPSFVYKQIPYNGKDIIIKGYWQSYKYADRKTCQQQYACPPNVMQDITSRYSKILEERPTVSVNVRRGDYLTLPHRHPFCGYPFYRDAIAKFGDKYNFIISSDDIEWCKKNFRGGNFYFIENSYPLLDLYIQTVCNHNIISNSSFSWWGAYLNSNPGQIIVAPDRWFGMEIEKTNSVSDLMLPEFCYAHCKLPFGQKLLAYKLYLKTIIKKLIFRKR